MATLAVGALLSVIVGAVVGRYPLWVPEMAAIGLVMGIALGSRFSA
jgi:hypothetical protein